MSPRSTRARDINIKRLFIDEQLRVSTLAQQFHMNEPAVSAVIRRHVGPAFDGCPVTTVPVLWRLQKAFADLYGEEQALELLFQFGLLNGQSAEAYILQEAGISSDLYHVLVQGEKSRKIGLREMVEIDPIAAYLAVQRLEEQEHSALEHLARKIRKHLKMGSPVKQELAAKPTPVLEEVVRPRQMKQQKRIATGFEDKTLAPVKPEGVAEAVAHAVTSPWRRVAELVLVGILILLMAWLLMTVG
jgi:hypothetical protein